MDKIDWSNFDGDRFQLFCNVLLSFEVSKRVEGFGAKGSDGGIDARFSGEYNNKKGKWRFQAKLHLTDRRTAVSNLKNQIKEDILGRNISRGVKGKSNVKHEDFLVFLTNIKLIPNEKDDLIKTGNEALRSINKENVEFDIWDGIKLLTIYVRFPIIKHWFGKREIIQLKDYKLAFEKELKTSIKDNFTLNNQFVSRESYLQEMEFFFKDNSISTAVISGEAGIGKTRLCIESFRRFIDDDDDWKALVMTSQRVDIEKIAEVLVSEKNLSILIDDAHNYSPQAISDLKSLVDLHKGKNKIKLILTVRTVLLSQILRNIKEYKQGEIKKINLEKLSPEDTEKFLEIELKEYVPRLSFYLSDLTAITNGRPILIVTLVREIMNGTTDILKIKKDNFLRDYVSNFFEEFCTVMSNESGIEKFRINNIIKLFCLLEPVNLTDKELLKRIADNEKINLTDLETLFEKLKNHNYILNEYEASIKPDFYSDILLGQTIKSREWLSDKIAVYSDFMKNIIVNLAVVLEEISKETEGDFIDTLLYEYIKNIDTSSFRELDSILKTISSIVYFKPQIAYKTVDKMFSVFDNLKHPLHKYLKRPLLYNDSTVSRIENLLFQLSYMENYYGEVFNLLKILYLRVKDKKLIEKIFGFNERDWLEGFCCKRQLYFLEKIENMLSSLEDKEQIDFAIEGCKALLTLHFIGCYTKPYKKYEISMNYFYVWENEQVKELRRRVIATLINYFTKTEDFDYRDKILNIILDIPRAIAFAREEKDLYKGESDIKQILDFLLDISKGDLHTKFKEEIVRTLYWTRRWKVVEGFDTINEKIKKNLEPSNLTGKLVRLFNPIDIDDFDHFFKDLNNKIITIIKEESIEDICISLIEITSDYGDTLDEFYRFFSVMNENYPQKSKQLIEIAWNRNPDFVIRYCSGSLNWLYFREGEDDFYWDCIQKIFNKRTGEAYMCVLEVYAWNIKNDMLTNRDWKLVKKIYKRKVLETFKLLSYALPNFLFFNKNKVLPIIKDFMRVCSGKDIDHLFNFSNKYPDEFYEEAKDLLLNGTIRFDLSYPIKKYLEEILIKEGDEIVFDYFMKRWRFYKKWLTSTSLDLISKSVANQGKRKKYFIFKPLLFTIEKWLKKKKSVNKPERYWPGPAHDEKRLFRNLDTESYLKLFERFLGWFILKGVEPGDFLFINDILKYMRPSDCVTKELESIYDDFIEKYYHDGRKLINIVDSLSVFEEKNERLVAIVIKVLEIAYKTYYPLGRYRKIEQRCYSALNNVDKSHKIGEPDKSDIIIKELLIDALKKNKDKPVEIKNLLQSLLKKTEQDIEKAINEGKEEW